VNHLYTQKSSINGHGLHTRTPLKKGERVGVIHGDVEIVRKFTPKLSEMSWNWIGIGRYSWINTKNSPFKYINHSCAPNTYISGKRQVIALKNIATDEELTMDYSLTEADPDFWLPGGCTCQAPTCRKKVGPVYSLSARDFQKHLKIITAPFKKIYEVEAKKHNTIKGKNK
jgi:SET domain